MRKRENERMRESERRMKMEWEMSASLLENLKVDHHPWLPPNTWESIPSESGVPIGIGVPPHSSSNQTLSTLSVSSTLFRFHNNNNNFNIRNCCLTSFQEASLVRLAMNGMQGVKTSLITIQNLSPIFSSHPLHTHTHSHSTSLHLWNRASTTHSLANILKTIASTGSLVFLLRHFVDYFTNMNVHQNTLVNQAFAVAVGKVLEGFISGLDTIHASLIFRRSSKHLDFSLSGCLKSVVHSEITLLELYLHTKQLRIQIEALASICNLQNCPPCVSDTDFEDLITKSTSQFSNFCRGGNLLTFLYAQLQVTLFYSFKAFLNNIYKLYFT